MSVQVDPFVIPIPDKWNNDKELAPTVQYLWKFLYDIWKRTGGGNDAIAEIGDSTLYDVGIKGAEIAEILKQLEELRVQFTIIENALAHVSLMSSILQDITNQTHIESQQNTQKVADELIYQDNTPLLLAELSDLRKRVEAIERGYDP